MLKIFLADNGKNLGTLQGLGPLGFEGVKDITKEGAFKLFNDTISIIIGLLTIIAGIWFLFQVIIAGFQWLSSSGDKASIENARNKLTHSVIGLVIVVMAFAIISIIGNLLGIEFLKPTEVLQSFPLPGGSQ